MICKKFEEVSYHDDTGQRSTTSIDKTLTSYHNNTCYWWTVSFM